MWQAPSMHAASSSDSNENVDTGDGIVSLTASEDRAENRISPNPPTACTLGIPVSEYQYDMSSNINLQRQRGYRRRTYDRRQMHQQPCRMTNFNTLSNMPSSHCNRQNLDQESNSRNTHEESSFRGLTKRRSGNQYIGDIFENQQETENDAPTTDDAERGLLVRSSSSQDSHSFETFSPSLLQLGSTCIQSISPVSQIDNSSANELGLEQESELPLIPLIRVDNTCEEPFELNTKPVSPSQGQHILKPLLNFDNPFFSPPRIFPEFPTPSANARKLANNLIKLSRYLKAPNLTELCCLDCGYVPVLPVTGQCGHTRCMRCIMDNGDCPCTAHAPKTLLVNTVVRQIIEKMMRYITGPRTIEAGSSARDDNSIPQIGVEPRHLIKRRHNRYLHLPPVANSIHCLCRPRMPMTIQARYRRARHFLAVGKYLEAASHLARVAASSEPIARNARILLAQTINAMWCKRRRRGHIPRRLRQSVREQAAHSWLKPSDLECVLCTDTFSSPVCTPCGHTYCRECIERCLYFQKKCALCLSSLENFNLDETRDTVFITSILSSIDVIPSRGEMDVIPVVTCHVAYPGMPCPLFVFNPRYCLMVQRVLESGSRRFGMLAYNFASYGTVLEIRDCVLFEDSRCIVSTVGVSRFRVVERFVEDGCDVARIRSLSDINLIRMECRELHLLAVQVYSKAVCWLHSMDVRTKSVLDEIQTAFGSLPFDVNPEDLETSDGPYWLWWLVAILPLNREIKFLILSTRSLLKRMLAVSRALDLVDTDPSSHASSEVPVNSEEWLPSNS